MIYCQYCGVELEDNMNFCPLCGEAISKDSAIKPDHLSMNSKRDNKHTAFKSLSLWQQRKVFLEIVGLILFMGILVTTTINLLNDHTLSWSIIVIATALMLFINFSLILFLFRKILLLLSLSFLTSVAFFYLINCITGNTDSIIQFSIPIICLCAYITTYSLIVIIRKMKQKGLNLIAFSILASGILCLCIDATISIYIQKYLELNWSLIVMAAAIFISSLLLYLHGRLRKATDLKRFFHI